MMESMPLESTLVEVNNIRKNLVAFGSVIANADFNYAAMHDVYMQAVNTRDETAILLRAATFDVAAKRQIVEHLTNVARQDPAIYVGANKEAREAAIAEWIRTDEGARDAAGMLAAAEEQRAKLMGAVESLISFISVAKRDMDFLIRTLNVQ